MAISRRQFLKGAVIGGVGMALPTLPLKWNVKGAHAFYQSSGIPLFKTILRGVGPGQIPVAAPVSFPAPVTGVTWYQMEIKQFQDQIVPTSTGMGPTTLWGYNPVVPLGGGSQPQKHLGGIIVAKGRNPNDASDKAVPIQITFHNLLFVNKHLVPVDTTIPGANQAINRTAIHLHGGLIPWVSDGGPFDSFGPIDDHGTSFLNNKVFQPIHLPGAAAYYYPMNQSARFMWYHDHAFGITRLNAYAGVASAMLVRDSFEAGLIPKGLPPYIETSVLGGTTVQELPLVFQDKIFVGTDIKTKDPKWINLVQPAATKPGSLWYAHTYEPNDLLTGLGRWDYGPVADPANAGSYVTPLPDPSSIPEFFGDTMLVNGTVFPEATVQARRYRLRMLNACNARFLNLQLYIDDGSPNGITLDLSGAPFLPDGSPNLSANPNYGAVMNDPLLNPAVPDAVGNPTASWLQIGTEGGFLSKPASVPSNQPFGFKAGYPGPDQTTGQTDPSQVLSSLLIAPAERPDLIVDFSAVPKDLLKDPTGKTYKNVILYSDSPAPYPGGDDRNDYFPGYNFNPQGVGKAAGAFGLGNPINKNTQPGFGPNTRVLMRFKVVPATSSDTALQINTSTDLTPGIDKALIPWGIPVAPVAVSRFLSLNEYFDERGRLIQILGNDQSPYGAPYDQIATYPNYAPNGKPQTVPPAEEVVQDGKTEVWSVYNATGDVHPMHFHLVNVQLISRRLFDVANLNFTPGGLQGPPIPANDNEKGWKETVPMYPGTVTTVIMKFDLSLAKVVDKNGKPVTTKEIPGIQLPITNGEVPDSPRTGGKEYVWHCHILEHEEHDMMHALVVKPK